MFYPASWPRPLILLSTVFLALAGLAVNLQAYQTPKPSQFSDVQPAAGLQTPDGGEIPAAIVIETFPNSWHVSTIGLVYNHISQTVLYAHEGQSGNPATIWNIASTSPYTPLQSFNLNALNAGWPLALNDRDGVEYDPVANSYFLPDFSGDNGANRDDNLIEMTPAGVILNAWELDGAGNDSSDGSIINSVIDIALVPGTPNRYFMTAADSAGTVYEVALTRAGLFTPASWSTVNTCTVPGMGDNVGIGYDNINEVLYHSSFNNENIVITDLSCNVLFTFSCNGGGSFHTGVTYLENSDPAEVWVTDFNSNSTTRCIVPHILLEKTASSTADCQTPVDFLYPGEAITYCYQVMNISSEVFGEAITYTTHSLIDDQLGTILDNVPYPLAPGATYLVSLTTYLTQTTTNIASWTATNGTVSDIGSDSLAVAVLNSPPSLCQSYSNNTPVFIPSNTTVTSIITVSEPFTLFDVNVGLHLNHTWDADLVISLLDPQGQGVNLVNSRGGNGDNFHDTIFDSQAATPIAAGSPPFTGRFIPEQSLNILNGQVSTGTWTLQINDIASGDQGTLNSWYIELCEPPAAALEFTATVGTEAGVCASTTAITVTPGTEVYYCYEVTNSGNYTLASHNLADNLWGVIFADTVYNLGPGETVNTSELGLTITTPMTQTTVNTATWSAETPGFVAASADSAAAVFVTNLDVDAGEDQAVDEGEMVQFSGSYTETVDPLGGEAAILWDFGDGSTAAGVLTPTHVYPDNGVYTVTLTVTNGNGIAYNDQLVVTVENVAPTVTVGADITVTDGTPITLTAQVMDPGADNLTYLWDFGNGDSSTALTPTYTYTETGLYTVTLTVTDDDGDSGSDTLLVTILNEAPEVTLGADITITAGTSLTFTAQVVDFAGDNLTYLWDFGNGDSSTALTPTYTYTETGLYTVTLTVTDDDGDSGTDTLLVVVLNNGFTLYLPVVNRP